MKTASIIVEIGTICNGNIVKNKVTLQIPREAAVIISEAWNNDELPQREAIVAHNLLGNQFAHCDLVIDNGIGGGMLNMVKENTDNEKYFSTEEYEEEYEDDLESILDKGSSVLPTIGLRWKNTKRKSKWQR